MTENISGESSIPKRHLKLFPYLLNHHISSNEMTNIYRRSKVYLNIGAIEHLSLNPRTFEILATGSFQLTDHIYKKVQIATY